MQMLKYRAVGSDVQAVEVTEKNAADVAEAIGAQHFISPRTDKPYVLVETPTGSERADVGSFVIVSGTDEEPVYAVLDAEMMARTYARP